MNAGFASNYPESDRRGHSVFASLQTLRWVRLIRCFYVREQEGGADHGTTRHMQLVTLPLSLTHPLYYDIRSSLLPWQRSADPSFHVTERSRLHFIFSPSVTCAAVVSHSSASLRHSISASQQALARVASSQRWHSLVLHCTETQLPTLFKLSAHNA